MAMCAVSAGAARTAAPGNSGFQMHVSAITDSPASGDGAVGVFSSAVAAFYGCIRLREGSYSFKFMIAVFADIFVNRHSFLLIPYFICNCSVPADDKCHS